MARGDRRVWALAATLSLPFGSVLGAPADCLNYRDNPQVAACANAYGPSTTTPRPHAAPVAPAPVTRSVQVGATSDLRAVAVVPGGKLPAAPEPPPQTFLVDRAALTNTIIAGAIGGCLLVLVALGAWRWGSTLKRACPHCGSKISRSARSCRHCFRSV